VEGLKLITRSGQRQQLPSSAGGDDVIFRQKLITLEGERGKPMGSVQVDRVISPKGQGTARANCALSGLGAEATGKDSTHAQS
jgi:hypothetical protein